MLHKLYLTWFAGLYFMIFVLGLFGFVFFMSFVYWSIQWMFNTEEWKHFKNDIF